MLQALQKLGRLQEALEAGACAKRHHHDSKELEGLMSSISASLGDSKQQGGQRGEEAGGAKQKKGPLISVISETPATDGA